MPNEYTEYDLENYMTISAEQQDAIPIYWIDDPEEDKPRD